MCSWIWGHRNFNWNIGPNIYSLLKNVIIVMTILNEVDKFFASPANQYSSQVGGNSLTMALFGVSQRRLIGEIVKAMFKNLFWFDKR